MLELKKMFYYISTEQLTTCKRDILACFFLLLHVLIDAITLVIVCIKISLIDCIV